MHLVFWKYIEKRYTSFFVTAAHSNVTKGRSIRAEHGQLSS